MSEEGTLSPLPPGWTRHFSNSSHRWYYLDSASGVIQSNHPWKAFGLLCTKVRMRVTRPTYLSMLEGIVTVPVTSLRTLIEGEIVEVLEESTKYENGITRIKCCAVKDGVVGWATVARVSGLTTTTYLEKCEEEKRPLAIDEPSTSLASEPSGCLEQVSDSTSTKRNGASSGPITDSQTVPQPAECPPPKKVKLSHAPCDNHAECSSESNMLESIAQFTQRGSELQTILASPIGNAAYLHDDICKLAEIKKARAVAESRVKDSEEQVSKSHEANTALQQKERVARAFAESRVKDLEQQVYKLHESRTAFEQKEHIARAAAESRVKDLEA
eukprot:CAMPEP_0203879164 /NCGR_PEP_ID=MMETSP0359-20131031/23663_1 /ASSEMBLY_ACC=CAM_ASM_000338 /TAXON_ID=268821 /ORGANISM="Scrippsiella Hangoei, Strain SHTV-5" /LENGTH=328 /DNA_ID=CAMNT_0050798521 /DNA_START=9 /DNA_END=992 /DNA_ORIENTATION=+